MYHNSCFKVLISKFLQNYTQLKCYFYINNEQIKIECFELPYKYRT